MMIYMYVMQIKGCDDLRLCHLNQEMWWFICMLCKSRNVMIYMYSPQIKKCDDLNICHAN